MVRGMLNEELTFRVSSQHCAHVGPDLREEAQVCVQTALLAGEEGRANMLHLQP